jgi:hypothetical protein
VIADGATVAVVSERYWFKAEYPPIELAGALDIGDGQYQMINSINLHVPPVRACSVPHQSRRLMR